MSNGDNVLDNWEEIDEAGVNISIHALKTSSTATCERIAINSQSNIDLATTATTTNCLRSTQMKLLQRSNTQDSTSSLASNPLNKSPLDDMSATFQPVMMVLHKPQDEYQSVNYTAPIANQTVKILRRPTQSTEIRNNGIRPKQPIKTLQQREQEYAEARLRILGSAKNPEDEELRASATSTIPIVSSTTSSTPTTPTAIPAIGLSNNIVTSMVTTAKNNSPKIQIAANQYNSTFNQQLQQQQKYQQNYQQQQQSFYYNQQQQPQPPAYNNNRTYNINPLLALGPMGPIGQPAQYQNTGLSSPQTQQQFKYQQYHQKSPQQQHKSQHQQTWSPVVGGSVSSSSIRQQPNDTILRLPRGPDGSTGFQMRR